MLRYPTGLLAFMVLILSLNSTSHADEGGMSEKRQVIDSLLNVLPTASDVTRVDILMQLSNIYLSISMDSSREYAKLALNKARDLKNRQKVAENYRLLGNISFYQGQLNQVVGFYDSSLVEYQSIQDTNGQAKVWNNLGIVYHNLGDYQKSINYHLKSLEYKTGKNDSIGIATSLANIGSIYLELKEYTKAYDFLKDALTISLILNQRSTVAGILNNLGMINQEVGDQAKAIEYFKQSLAVGQEIGHNKGIADNYHNLGKSSFLLHRYSEALDYYDEALKLYDQLGIKNSNTLNNIAQVYIELDYHKQALAYLHKALNIALESNQIKNIRDIYNNLSVANSRLGNYKKAHELFLLYHAYDDSLKSQIYSSRVEEIITKNEIEKQGEQIEKARLELEKKETEIRNRNLIIYTTILGMVISLVFAIVLFRLFRHKEKANVLLKQRNDEILRSQKTIKKINKALTESEGKLRSIFDISPYSIFVVGRNLTIFDCNDTAMSMFHVKSKHDLLQKNMSEFVVSGIDVSEPVEIISEFLSNDCQKRQYRLKRPDRSLFYAEIAAREIEDPSEKPNLYVIVITDITERLDFIDSLREAKMKAEESDKLKTAFLANMSHEIRTPMNSIVGFTNLLTDPDLAGAKRNEFLSHIMQSSKLLLNLIDDIIDISKIEAGHLNFSVEKFYLNHIVRDLFHTYKETSSKPELSFSLILPHGTDTIRCETDPLRLRQVLSNLISNAVKFTKEGVIEIGYNVKDSNSIPVVEFYVKDSGIGIPKEKQQMIFERFRQVDDSRTRTYGGTGLGLSISKRLIEVMGGKIGLESEVGKGSTFFFTLPYIREKATPKVPIEKEDATQNWHDKTILVAEDENSNYELLKATLNQTNIKVVRVLNGEDAVNFVKSEQPVDMVLMDIRMPKMNGYDATRHIKSIHPELPVIAITAYAMSEDEAKSLEAGCDLYLSKPIKPSRLLEIIEGFFVEI
jgi:PAS domain S-box-containing protein